ncbi:MAG: YegP family protein [Chloroflexota bacterium]
MTTYSAVGTAVFIVYQDKASGYRWTLFAANNKKIADSGEAYVTRSNAREAAELVKRLAPTATIRDQY